jgi:hypothetical protein
MRWLLIAPRFQEPQKLEKRRMKDSNLQVVSYRMSRKHLQYHYWNTAYLAVCQTAINIKSKKKLQPITVNISAKILGCFPRKPPDLVTVFYSAFR